MRALIDQTKLTEWPCTSCGTVLPAHRYKSRGTRFVHSKAPRHTQCNRCLYVKYTRPDAERKTQAVQDHKLSKGCADCGYNGHPAALEFDHRPGEVKLFNIGEKVGSYTEERVWAEISKCDVVCANCHAIRTVNRRTRVGREVMT